MQRDSSRHVGWGRVLDCQGEVQEDLRCPDSVIRDTNTLAMRCATRIKEPYPVIRPKSSLGLAGGLKCRADVLVAVDLLPGVHVRFGDEIILVGQEPFYRLEAIGQQLLHVWDI